MNHKSLALSGFAVLSSIIAAAAVLATPFTALKSLTSLDPVAALTAITVAIIGFAWFKKSMH